ncbi:hypothetical protein C0993_003997, partial [Termitomyces sp. T159_Od127]
MNPADLKCDNKRLSLADLSGPFCVCLTTGVVSGSHLFHSAVPVGGDQKYGQHRVELYEFHQESLRQFAVLRQVMNLVDGIRGSVSSNGVAFITRGEGKTPRFNN